jgi:glutaredoxin
VDPTPTGTAITVVYSHGCHYCDEARDALAEIGATHPLRVSYLEAASPEGAQLTAQYRVPMFPLVLVDGKFFSHGRLPRRKLLALLQSESKSETTAGTR